MQRGGECFEINISSFRVELPQHILEIIIAERLPKLVAKHLSKALERDFVTSTIVDRKQLKCSSVFVNLAVRDAFLDQWRYISGTEDLRRHFGLGPLQPQTVEL